MRLALPENTHLVIAASHAEQDKFQIPERLDVRRALPETTHLVTAVSHAESENTQAQAQLNALAVLLGRSLLTKLQATSLWHV